MRRHHESRFSRHSPQALAQCLKRDDAAWIFCPIGKQFYFSESFDPDAFPCVAGLLASRNPSAVVWAVWPVIVDSLKRQSGDISVGAGPSMKVAEVSKPFGANGDTSPAPVLVARAVGAVAAGFHAVVRVIQRRPDVLGMRPSLYVPAFAASTSAGVAASEVALSGSHGAAAITEADKVLASTRATGVRNDCQFGKSLSDHMWIVRDCVNQLKAILRTFGLISP